MKIHNENPLNRLHGFFDPPGRPARAGRTGATGEAGTACRTGENARRGGDGLKMSSGEREIAELRTVIDGLPDVRQQLVERVLEEIASGLYCANGRRIADAMLDEERWLAGRSGETRP